MCYWGYGEQNHLIFGSKNEWKATEKNSSVEPFAAAPRQISSFYLKTIKQTCVFLQSYTFDKEKTKSTTTIFSIINV